VPAATGQAGLISGLASGPPHQHRQRAVGEHLLGFAAEDEGLDAAAAVGGHQDQIAAEALGCLDDRGIGLVADAALGCRDHPTGGGQIQQLVQVAIGQVLHPFTDLLGGKQAGVHVEVGRGLEDVVEDRGGLHRVEEGDAGAE